MHDNVWWVKRHHIVNIRPVSPNIKFTIKTDKKTGFANSSATIMS